MSTTPQEQMKAAAEQMAHTLADEGRLVEAGWVSFKASVMPPDAPDLQVEGMRVGFYAGCAHLFSSIMVILDPSGAERERDLNRMGQIHAELEAFKESFEPKGPPQ